MYIGICGLAGSGKDTSADYLSTLTGFKKYSFAAPLKKMLAAIGAHEPKREDKEKVMPGFGVSYRHMAQTLGTEWGRNLQHSGFWVDMAINSAGADAIFSDTRFVDEAQIVKSKGGIVIMIEGRGGIASNHPSEGVNELRPYVDYFIDNSGEPAALYRQLDKVYADLVKKSNYAQPN